MLRSLAILIFMAGITNAAVVGVAETWPDDSLQGWLRYDPSQPGGLTGENIAVSEGALQLSPVVDPEATINPRWSFVAGAGASSGKFTGSLYDVGASMLTFDFSSSVPATLTIVWINSANGIFYNASFPVGGGGPASSFSVPLDPDHFTLDPFSFSDDFEYLMRNTDEFWFTMDWDKDAVSPVFRIDNVMLMGAGDGYGPWIDAFGKPSASRLPGTDADSDGYSNADEYIADTSPYENASRLEGISSGDGIEWISSTNCNYTVLRSTNLATAAFVPLVVLPGSGDDISYHDDELLPCAFYKLRAERK